MRSRGVVLFMFCVLSVLQLWGAAPSSGYPFDASEAVERLRLPVNERSTIKGLLSPDIEFSTSNKAFSALGERLNKPKYSIPDSFLEYRSVAIGASIIGVGLVMTIADRQVREMRNDYMFTFRHHYDDYLQYAPAVAMLSLKAAGVESRSSWGRMLVSDAFSVALMGSVVNGLKYTVRRERPDGSGNNSFPSGHTAMAYMTATMLYKEYGTTRGPLYSILGYSAATATAVSRTFNNKHWLSDVLVGAGVGILSTELGYYLADLIFKDRGLLRQSNEMKPVYLGRRPSFVGVNIGHNILPYSEDRYRVLASSGVGVGIEGAWFFSDFVGIGGSFNIDRIANVIANRYVVDMKTEGTEPINKHSLQAGFYLSYPLPGRWFLIGKVLGGVKRTSSETTRVLDSGGEEYAQLNYSSLPDLTLTVGGGLMYVLNSSLGLRFYSDYSYLHRSLKVIHGGGESEKFGTYIFPITLGVSIDALLW